MASFTDVVKGQVVSIANEGFKRVTGGLRGVIGSAIEDLNPISRIFDQNQSKGKLDPKSFTVLYGNVSLWCIAIPMNQLLNGVVKKSLYPIYHLGMVNYIDTFQIFI